MAIQIDTFETEIQIEPSKAAHHVRPASHAHAPAAGQAMSADAHRRAVLSVLESELDQYIRMRG